ncbi:transposase [Acinetobacter defluvii]|uniref:transposase n=1 Tax=Acinetobacter defluvii TaxID=1871111 RepID=UPI00149078BB
MKCQHPIIYQNKLFAVGLFDCKVNSDVLHFWVEKFLIPELPENSVIVMDNAAFHKRQDIQDLIMQHGIKYSGFLLIVEISILNKLQALLEV